MCIYIYIYIYIYVYVYAAAPRGLGAELGHAVVRDVVLCY